MIDIRAMFMHVALASVMNLAIEFSWGKTAQEFDQVWKGCWTPSYVCGTFRGCEKESNHGLATSLALFF